MLGEGTRLVKLAAEQGVLLRLFGGAAVLAHCPNALRVGGERAIADLDVVVAPRQGRRLADVLRAAGYQPEIRFNAIHGSDRMLFHGPLGQLDVIVGTFAMCHKIDLAPRLALDEPTLPVTDLLLTKLQVVQLNEKDATDALALLREHEVGRTEGDVVNIQYLGQLAGDDWGLWRTISGTLERLKELSKEVDVLRRVDEILDSLEAAPKGIRFKLRARVGERIPWYELPEEVG